jgi:two-component system chemotaxis response regulator CheY
MKILDTGLFHFEARHYTELIKSKYLQCQVEKSQDLFLSIVSYVNALYDYSEILFLEEIHQYIKKFREFLNILHKYSLDLPSEDKKIIYTAADMIMLLSHKYNYEYTLEPIHMGFLESTTKSFEKYSEQYPISDDEFYQSEIPKNISQDDKTILFVDDSLTVRKICEKMAIVHGYKVQIATNGFHGYRLAKNYKYDLIFSDINMPQMDGLDMVELIRDIKHHKFTPIVMLTTERDKEMMDRAKSMKVKAWLVKPFKKEKLFQIVEKILMQ